MKNFFQMDQIILIINILLDFQKILLLFFYEHHMKLVYQDHVLDKALFLYLINENYICDNRL